MLQLCQESATWPAEHFIASKWKILRKNIRRILKSSDKFSDALSKQLKTYFQKNSQQHWHYIEID